MIKPPDFTTVFPYIFSTDPDAYLRFLEDGLGGAIQGVHRMPSGGVANAQIVFGDTKIMVSDAAGWTGPTNVTYYLYVADADAAVARALAAGGELFGAVKDQPYGDRRGGVRDPFGNVWWISHRLQADQYRA